MFVFKDIILAQVDINDKQELCQPSETKRY
jgi:hypothetical protein